MRAEDRACGADWRRGRGTRFRVWAPRARRVSVVFEDRAGVPLGEARMKRERGGLHSALVARAKPGDLYRYRLDGGDALPDPWSRFQPAGPHGPSEIIDPRAYRWKNAGWRGLKRTGQVLYELHVGTFTPEGTWDAASRRLGWLKEIGVTAVEVMPVGEFPGRFGWGYDGVGLFAPARAYGTPDDFRRFVDRAHAAGLGVILDVVYNHFGPDGAYFGRFAREWFRAAGKTEWGDAINYDGPGSERVREFVVANAAYWVSEFRVDGLRLDATQSIRDASATHVIAELGTAARAAGRGRGVLLFAENERQDAALARPRRAGGLGLDAIWNDDFHHSARAALTGRREAYYSGYAGSPQELISCATRGFLFQGQYYEWQKNPRGTPSLDLPGSAYVCFLENHDQVSNSLDGRRLRFAAHPGDLRALTALLLLGPWTPLLFQGQEFGATAPFQYFADHRGALGRAVAKGRRDVLRQFPSYAGPEGDAYMPAPGSEETFMRCKLDWTQSIAHREFVALHRDLLRLRREDAAFSAQRSDLIAGAVLSPGCFVLRWLGPRGGERLLAVNLGCDESLATQAEPLLAPPAGARWRPLWHSESPVYGGLTAPPPLDEKGAWNLPAHSAVVLGAS